MEKLLNYARKLKNPEDYFAGTPPLQLDLPTNVLIFSRRSSRHLTEKKHYHHRYVLLINISGNGNVVLDSKIFTFNPGRILLIFPHQFHHYHIQKDQQITWLYITFELPSSDHLMILKNKPLPMAERCLSNLQTLLKEYITDSPEPYRKNRILLYCSLLLNDLLDTAASFNEPSSSHASIQHGSIIDKTHQYIYKNLHRPIRITDISQHVALSESHLRQLYRNVTGISLGEYIKEIKIRKATELFCTTSMNISEVAFACGFNSLFSFSRAFKRKMHVSPRNYRNGNCKRFA
jgi:AraC-like DNA-binding protein